MICSICGEVPWAVTMTRRENERTFQFDLCPDCYWAIHSQNRLITDPVNNPARSRISETIEEAYERPVSPFHIASGSIGYAPPPILDGAVVSGAIRSGQVYSFHIASGSVGDYESTLIRRANERSKAMEPHIPGPRRVIWEKVDKE